MFTNIEKADGFSVLAVVTTVFIIPSGALLLTRKIIVFDLATSTDSGVKECSANVVAIVRRAVVLV